MNIAFDPQLWRPTFRSALFWARYFCVEHRLPGLPNDSQPPADDIEFEFGRGPALRISLGAGVSLGILPAGREEKLIELGWEDGCHGHPHVFRWSECVALAQYLAGHVFDEPFPGNALLLLALFSPITKQEVDDAQQLICTAFHFNGIHTDVANVIADSCVMPYHDFGWKRVADGRYECVGEGAASLRRSDNKAFPFSLVEELIAEATA